MSFISHLVDPNPPLTAAQVQEATAAAINATPAAGTVKAIQRGEVLWSGPGGSNEKKVSVTLSGATLSRLQANHLGVITDNRNSSKRGEPGSVRLVSESGVINIAVNIGVRPPEASTARMQYEVYQL